MVFQYKTRLHIYGVRGQTGFEIRNRRCEGKGQYAFDTGPLCRPGLRCPAVDPVQAGGWGHSLGTVEAGRPFEIKGAHVRGHNEGSIGICWIGRDDIDDKQLVTLKKLVLTFTSKYKLDVTEDVYGHYELDSGKTCPNLDMIKFRAELIFDV